MKNWVGRAKTRYSRRTCPEAVEADGVAESIPIGVRLHVGGGRLLDADADDLETAIAVLVRERAQDRGLLLAWRAPRGEEVQPHDLAPKGGERDRFAVEVLELVRGAVAEVDRELGCRRARLQAFGRLVADDERRRQRVDEVWCIGRVAKGRRHGDPEDRDDEHGDRPGEQLAAAERPDQPMAGALVGERRPLGLGRHAIRSPSGTGSSAAAGEAGRAPSRHRSPTPATRRSGRPSVRDGGAARSVSARGRMQGR